MRRPLSVYQMVFAAYSIYQASSTLLSGRYNPLDLLIIGLSIAMFAAGIVLFFKLSAGIRLSLIVQLIQLPILASPIFSYKDNIGLVFNITFVPSIPDVLVQVGHGSELQLWYSRPDIDWAVGINAVAGLCVCLLAGISRHDRFRESAS